MKPKLPILIKHPHSIDLSARFGSASYLKNLIGVTSLLLLIVIGLEVFSRYRLGLGDPPLLMAHESIEYMYRPDQDLYRFGNRFTTNQYGMRSPPFKPRKATQNEYRVMVFGDSVINGGNLTNHAELATTLLAEELSVKNEDVVVGNISAGSWGPGNWLAYAQVYGFFDADIVVLLISSHDYVDNPTFEPLNEQTHPTKKPVSALTEALTRYLPRYFPQFALAHRQPPQSRSQENRQVNQQGISDLSAFLELAQENSDRVIVLQHWERAELEQGMAKLGNRRIQQLVTQMDIPSISLAPFFRQAISEASSPYRDNIHPNSVGQRLIAEALLENLREMENREQ